MNLKKMAALSTAMVLGGLLSSSAFATAVDGALAARSGQNVILTDESGEFLIDGGYVPTNADGKLNAGDILVGALDFTTISPVQTFFQADLGRELTAVFGNMITASTEIGSFSDFTLAGAGAAFWSTNQAWLGGTNYKALVDATFVGNTIDWDKVTGILFDDAVEPVGTNFDRSEGIASSMFKASDGLIRGVIGFGSTDDFWISRAKTALSVFETTTSNQGNFSAGQSFLAENFSVDFTKTVDAEKGGASYVASPYADDLTYQVEIAIDGGLFGSGLSALDGNFSIYNKVDATVNPIPEPATLALLGLGLIGLASIRRKA